MAKQSKQSKQPQEPELTNYAHKDAPRGTRYVGVAGDEPEWAIDIQEGDGRPKNILGHDVHPTDAYLIYTGDVKRDKANMLSMRAAYDRLEDAGLTDAAQTLIDAALAKKKYSDDQLQWEIDMGPDL